MREEMKEMTQDIAEQSSKTKEIIDRFDRYLQDDLQMKVRVVGSLKSLLQEAIDKKYLPVEKHVQEIFVMDVQQDFEVYVCEGFMGHLIYNMVKNAYFRGNATQVRFTSNAAEHTLYITDNGKGIPQKHLPYIFDMFFSTKTKKGGGIGLHLIYKMLEATGAQIYCLSRPGQTQFRITFPAVTPADREKVKNKKN